MLLINYEDIDTSLRFIEGDYISEDRFLDLYEQDQLKTLKNNFENGSSKTTDSKEQEILKGRIEKVNSILKIHENKITQAIEYLKKPFSDVPDYPEKKINKDYQRIITYFDNDLLLSYMFNLTGTLDKNIFSNFSTIEEESVFMDNMKYIIEAIDYSLDLIEGVESFVKSDYPKIYRVLEFKKAISVQEF